MNGHQVSRVKFLVQNKSDSQSLHSHVSSEMGKKTNQSEYSNELQKTKSMEFFTLQKRDLNLDPKQESFTYIPEHDTLKQKQKSQSNKFEFESMSFRHDSLSSSQKQKEIKIHHNPLSLKFSQDKLSLLNEWQKYQNNQQIQKVQKLIENAQKIKMVSHKERFVKQNISADSQQRLRTLYKFGFANHEKEEKKYIFDIIYGEKVKFCLSNQIISQTQRYDSENFKDGSMCVSDLWSSKMRLKCLDRTRMMGDKKMLEKYLYLKTKDENDRMKEARQKIQNQLLEQQIQSSRNLKTSLSGQNQVNIRKSRSLKQNLLQVYQQNSKDLYNIINQIKFVQTGVCLTEKDRKSLNFN